MAINSLTPKLSSDWDLQLGADGNLKMCEGSEGITQNVACEGQNFKGGLYFHQEVGVPWFTDSLGQAFQRPIIAARLREAAEKVQGVEAVESVTVDDLDTEKRTVTGEITIQTKDGENGRAVIR